MNSSRQPFFRVFFVVLSILTGIGFLASLVLGVIQILSGSSHKEDEIPYIAISLSCFLMTVVFWLQTKGEIEEYQEAASCNQKPKRGGGKAPKNLGSLTTLPPERQPEVVDLLVDAFINDPLHQYIYQDRNTRKHLTGGFNDLVEFYVKACRFYVREINGEIIGCIGVRTPTEFPHSIPIKPTFKYIFKTLWRLCSYPLSSIYRLLKYGVYQTRFQPKKPPHWYLFGFAIKEDYRGQGLGEEIIQTIIDHVESLGEPAYLEISSEPMEDYYSKFGFKVAKSYTPKNRPIFKTLVRVSSGPGT